ncbi:MAG: anti-sigma factor antagonist [Eubacteriales bacterium]|nr:anti-sigma factor antagonist [Eubacteriales bacterium]
MNPLFETEGACLTIFLPKELDHPASDMIRKESDRIMNKTYIKMIIFDFGNTGFMDSSGIGLIMGRYRALGMRGGCIRAVHVNGHIDKLLHLSGVHRYVEIHRQESACGNIGE